MEKNWQELLAPYEQAVNELKVKLRGVRRQFRFHTKHVPIEFVTGRVKPVDSIITKMKLRGIPEERLEEEMQDLAGIRIMCQFVEDIYEIVEYLRARKDMHIVQERDYITNQKASGYRSYHLVVSYPIQMIEKERNIYVEIQIRTLAMNFWATIEHSLNYKYQGSFPGEINDRLKRAAEAAYLLDQEMSVIREEIQEAQRLFANGKGKEEDTFYQQFLAQEQAKNSQEQTENETEVDQ